ncbi:hypothetical protein QE450_004355 [Paenibacillus sp. SORGH_AS306]|uniref:hypothetical protein n=1 Tax=unclassified Paenibacillus TaxID=185978 RepID=UPI0027822C38|nr:MULTISPECIES: hypothetical protein [unclassified Paenibacillus]MDQ1236857.1 hypothetical protein [Paenibacillus sp. SORGH_AS_0306]MDR6109219.1 hypothetical protein [Paenibacillus sp. SORGH_AS_0338]
METTREQLWELVDHFENIDFWQGVSFAKVKQTGDTNGVGDEYECTFRTKMLFKLKILLKVADKSKPNQFKLMVEGPLAGEGTCFLEELDDGQATLIRCVWEVRLDHSMLRMSNPVMRPVYVWSHNKVMDEGVAGVGRHLQARVSEASHITKIYR